MAAHIVAAMVLSLPYTSIVISKCAARYSTLLSEVDLDDGENRFVNQDFLLPW